jgi:hypothetical protein
VPIEGIAQRHGPKRIEARRFSPPEILEQTVVVDLPNVDEEAVEAEGSRR